MRPMLTNDSIANSHTLTAFDDARCKQKVMVAQAHGSGMRKHGVYSGEELGVVQSRPFITPSSND